ncbi:MAG: peptidoglycan editing factor PgeF [Vicinamibacterales bacterium]|nr:peptidoglycan editing factor PgeF [Vicinamibacterales bacterium]
MILPKPTGEFEWTQESWGSALRCTALATTARHLFSTRQLTIPGSPTEDTASWSVLARALDLDSSRNALVCLRQVHRAGVFEAAAEIAARSPVAEWPEADIAISRDAAVGVTVRAADCVPVLLADRVTGAVSAIHAGWRGTAAGAVGAAVEAMTTRFGTEPRNVVAAVGPSIGPCCYTVGEELPGKFTSHRDAQRWFTRTRDGLRLDLWRATRDQLERAGVSAGNVHVSGLCTFDHPGIFHSYRRDGHKAGRLVAAIRANPKG